jgi:putative nucleotidyltransferase with HDIG domain
MLLPDAHDVELSPPRLPRLPLSRDSLDAAMAEQRFWRTIDKLNAWCADNSPEPTLMGRRRDFDPVAESSPLWEYVTTLARSVDHRSPWTAGHSMRVANLLVVMADQLRLGGDVRRYLRLAGLLHDVGNMGVPPHLFRKPERLSPDELSAVRRHPELGARIVTPVNLLRPVAAGIHHHHERVDGNGYPSGLCGESIPLIARMVGVACCFDAMTSTRPYRGALGTKVALDVMREEAGHHWDKALVEALARIVAEDQPARLPRARRALDRSRSILNTSW